MCGAGLDSWLTMNQHSCSLLRCRITRCFPCLSEEEERKRQPNGPPHWDCVDTQQHTLTFLLIFAVKPQSLLFVIGHAHKRTHRIFGVLWMHTIATVWMVLFDFKMVPVVSEAPLCCICGTAEDQPCRSRRADLWRRSTNPLQRIFSVGVWQLCVHVGKRKRHYAFALFLCVYPQKRSETMPLCFINNAFIDSPKCFLGAIKTPQRQLKYFRRVLIAPRIMLGTKTKEKKVRHMGGILSPSDRCTTLFWNKAIEGILIQPSAWFEVNRKKSLDTKSKLKEKTNGMKVRNKRERNPHSFGWKMQCYNRETKRKRTHAERNKERSKRQKKERKRETQMFSWRKVEPRRQMKNPARCFNYASNKMHARKTKTKAKIW